MHPDAPRTRRPRRRHGSEMRAQLAGVDLLTVEHYNGLAQEALRAGNMSVALDHLDTVRKAMGRATKMIRTGQ